MTTTYAAPDLSALGWIRDQDGAWLYVHADGALGAAGPVEIQPDLPASLGHYRLPDPPSSAAELRAAADCSVSLVNMLPLRIAAPLAGLAYRAAVSRMPGPVVIAGPSMRHPASAAPPSCKTSMAGVILHHFAPSVTRDAPASRRRGSTGSAVARLMYLTRDSLLLADDAVAEQVAVIVRAQDNAEARQRLDRNGELRDPEVPRGSLLVAAKERAFFPAPAALERALTVPFAPGVIDGAALVPLWEQGSRHGRAAVMASFVCWQAARREEVLTRTGELTAGYARAWTEAGLSERTAGTVANLAAGWRLMLDHLEDRGAYSASECAVLFERAMTGLEEAGRRQLPATAGGVR